jgi:beta-N-acetylhexosaminidase
LIDLADAHDSVVVGTVAASRSQGKLVTGLVATGRPVIAVALKTPFDILEYPTVQTYIATYSSHRPSMAALAARLFGGQSFAGRLPVPIEGPYGLGYGL